MTNKGDKRKFGNPKIVRGPKSLRGGFLVPTERSKRTNKPVRHRVVKPDGQRAKVAGKKLERVPSWMVRWMTKADD